MSKKLHTTTNGKKVGKWQQPPREMWAMNLPFLQGFDFGREGEADAVAQAVGVEVPQDYGIQMRVEVDTTSRAGASGVVPFGARAMRLKRWRLNDEGKAELRLVRSDATKKVIKGELFAVIELYPEANQPIG